jgi:uncharacterized RDD family membrane protein YckC
MGARSVAWLVDAVLLGAILMFFLPTPVSPLATYYDIPDGVDDACQALQDNEDIDVGVCLAIGDKAYVTEPPVLALQFAVEVGLFLIVYVVWQGYTGMTPGKALLGVRAVGEDGQPPGMGKAFVRSILWIVDSFPYALPLVGFVVGLTSTGHRRVGDMAAKTYVVAAADAGQPIVVPGYTPGYTTPSTTYAGYGATGYQAQTGASTWGAQQSPVAGTASPAWGQQQQQPSTGYPAQPPTADTSGYGQAAPYPMPAATQPTSPYGGTPAEQASPYGTPLAQPSGTEAASPYGGAPAQPGTDAASPYGGTPAQPGTETTSPYGGTPAEPSSTEAASPYGGTPAQPGTETTSPYGGTPAEPSSTEAASPYGGTPAQPSEPASSGFGSGGWPAQPTPSTPAGEPGTGSGSSAEPTSTAPERPVTWPPVVPSPESIGMPGSGDAPAATPSPTDQPASEPAAEQSTAPAEPAAGEDTAATEAGEFSAPTGYVSRSEIPTSPEPPAAESPPAATEADEAPPGAPPTDSVPGGGSGYKPQWDAARNAYIQWDPTRQRWIQWDDTAKEWKVI